MTTDFNAENIHQVREEVIEYLKQHHITLVDNAYYNRGHLPVNTPFKEWERVHNLTGIAVETETYTHSFKPDDISHYVSVKLANGSSFSRKDREGKECGEDWQLKELAKKTLSEKYLLAELVVFNGYAIYGKK